jgi:hypothetical protein
MNYEPQQFSSFCFLDQARKQKLEILISEIDTLCGDFTMQIREGHEDRQMIDKTVIATPQRNALESGSKYEADLNAWARKRLTKTEQLLHKKWETCVIAADRVEDLIMKKNEVRKFIMDAETNRPKEGSHAWRASAGEMTLPVRDSLNALYDRIHAFAATPLQAMHDAQLAKLDGIVKDIKELEADHTRYCTDAAHKLTGGNKEDKRLAARSKALGATLDAVARALMVSVNNLPDLREVHEGYKEIGNNVRRKA